MNRAALVMLLAGCSLFGGELEEIAKEPEYEKRFEKALSFAEKSAEAARKVVSESGTKSELEAALDDVTGGVKLAYDALRSSGKPAKKMTKQYKRGELKSRDIVKKLDAMIQALGVEYRPDAEKARDEVALRQEEFLLAVMTGK